MHPITAVQNEWSLFTREDEQSAVPVCAELGIGYVPNCPLGRGLLTGAYSATSEFGDGDVRTRVSRFAAENVDHNLTLIKTVTAIADAHNATTAQVALAWLMRQSEVHGVTVVPIPGTANVKWLAENAGAVDVALTDEDSPACVLGAFPSRCVWRNSAAPCPRNGGSPASAS